VVWATVYWHKKLKISLKIFLGYFALVGLAAWFVLTIFVDEVKPGVRQAMEDTLVDTANVLAALATEDVKNGSIQTGNFAQSLLQYKARASKANTSFANISGVKKLAADYRVYITNVQGMVIFDSANLALGQDYSRWNDVYLTLRGKYGVRSSPIIAGQPQSDSVMYIAAPIFDKDSLDGSQIIGSLTVAKSNRTVLPFIERAQNKIMRWGALLLVLSLIIGTLFTWRFTRKINDLREYAIKVAKGEKAIAPTSSNDELTDLAKAMQTMRSELDGKQYVQENVQHLTHELKSPITAIQGAVELISPQMPPADQARFLAQIKTQSTRVQTIIQNMLGLASLEHQQQLSQVSQVNLNDLINTQIEHLREKCDALQVNIHEASRADGLMSVDVLINADSFLLGQAIYNLLENALDFSPPNSTISVNVLEENKQIQIQIKDQGAGIPDYALDKIFDKFYSLPRPTNNKNAGQKSTGLGLNFVQEVAKLHSGSVSLINNQNGGVLAILTINK
jgi:two-component system, OmpR family, sensor histidine kinase CreC